MSLQVHVVSPKSIWIYSARIHLHCSKHACINENVQERIGFTTSPTHMATNAYIVPSQHPVLWIFFVANCIILSWGRKENNIMAGIPKEGKKTIVSLILTLTHIKGQNEVSPVFWCYKIRKLIPPILKWNVFEVIARW